MVARVLSFKRLFKYLIRKKENY